MKYSAYIPCYNNSATLADAIESVRRQSSPPDELLVVDDASTDRSVEIARSLGVRVVCHDANKGRGAVRVRAMLEAQHEWVLGCDAVNQLETEFVTRALKWLHEESVAGVFGIMIQRPSSHAALRWRGRHLFKYADINNPEHHAPLATGGSLLRASAVKKVGNFDPSMRHSEDADLGARLIASGFDMVRDPSLQIFANEHNTVAKVLERYWRWNAGKDERITFRGYLSLVSYGLKVMAAKDVTAKDYSALMITLICPHYQFWKSFSRTRRLK